jgi:hypothetical protein
VPINISSEPSTHSGRSKTTKNCKEKPRSSSPVRSTELVISTPNEVNTGKRLLTISWRHPSCQTMPMPGTTCSVLRRNGASRQRRPPRYALCIAQNQGDGRRLARARSATYRPYGSNASGDRANDYSKTSKNATLIHSYASSADRALAASKRIAGDIPRAGNVPDEGPILIEDVETIDVTPIGSEIFGLGHGPFAQTRSVLNDIGLVIRTGARPPSARLIEIRGMQTGQVPPKWWRYAP